VYETQDFLQFPCNLFVSSSFTSDNLAFSKSIFQNLETVLHCGGKKISLLKEKFGVTSMIHCNKQKIEI
jgi:hypothetical protein